MDDDLKDISEIQGVVHDLSFKIILIGDAGIILC